MRATNNPIWALYAVLPLLALKWGCIATPPTTSTASDSDPPVYVVVQPPSDAAAPTRTDVAGFDFRTVTSIPLDLEIVDPRGNPVPDAGVNATCADGTILLTRARTSSAGQLQTQVSFRIADKFMRIDVDKPFYQTASLTLTPDEWMSQAHRITLELDTQEETQEDQP